MPEDTDKKIDETSEAAEIEETKIEEVKKKKAEQSKKWPATLVVLSPLLVLFVPLYRAARYSVNWSAAIALVITFEMIMFLAEYFSVSRQHWIWNPDRIIGPTIFGGIPIEEPLLYYWFAPLFLVVLMHAIENWIKERSNK